MAETADQTLHPPQTSYKRIRKKRRWIGYLYILPVFIFLFVFIYFGIGYNIYISLFKWDGINEMQFIGLQNYIQLMSDSLFHNAVSNTFYFMLMAIPGSMLLGLVFAILLHSSSFGVNFFKSVFFLPYVMAIIVIGITFQVIYEPNFGLLNDTLRTVGLDALTRQWIGQPSIVLVSIVVVYIFAQVGFYMLLYYTSILNIDQDVFEASRIDGANVYKQIYHIIFPMLKGTHITLLILGVVASLKVFELVWIMTEGGPGGASELFSTYIFRKALLEFQQGYSAAISVVMLMLAFGITLFLLFAYNKARR